MPPKRKGFAGHVADSPAVAQAQADDVAALLAPRRTLVQDLPVERIRPNPFQARRTFSDLAELAAAISAQGFTSRLRVRPDPDADGTFQLVYGERRLRAAILAGLATVPCEIADHPDAEMFEIGLAENIQRRDLLPLEEAAAFRAALDGQGYSIRTLAERIGKDKSYVQDRLAVLGAPPDVQRMVEQRPDTLRAAREIAKLPTAEEREPLISGMGSGALNTAAVRSVVREVAPPLVAPRTPSAPRPPGLPTLEQDIRTVRTLLARWRTACPTLAGDEQEALREHVGELLAELGALADALEA